MRAIPAERGNRSEPLRIGIGIFLAVAGMAFLLLWLGFFDPAEDALSSARAQWLARAPTGQTAIVEIDAKSLAKLKTWPWSRRYHAQAVHNLHAAGAHLIAFDVDFSAASEPVGDRALAAAIREAAPVILPIFQQKLSDQANDRRTLASRPAAVFDSAWVGGVNIFPDRDGVVRAYPAAVVIEGNIQPSIATLLADNSQLGDRVFQPDWSIDARRIPRFSFVDVLEGRVPASALKGKRVVVGATAIELGDRYSVPRFGVIPGVVIQALATESLLQGRAIERSGWLPTVLGILIVAALLGAGRFRRPPVYAVVATGCVTLLLALPILAQAYWPVSIDSVAMLFAACASIGARVFVEVRRRIRLRSLTDAESGLPNRLMLESNLRPSVDAKPVLVTCAIERFEIIRDGIGIAASNEVIVGAAARIGKLVAGPVYRIAPDTLAWFQPDMEDHLVQARIEFIELSFRNPVETGMGDVDVTLTMGLDRDVNDSATVLRIERALSAIGSARSMGLSYQWYTGSDPVIRRQLSMMSALRQGLGAGDVKLLYQPKLSLRTNRIEDCEALMRWHSPTSGMVSPDEFIPLAEATGVVRDLTAFALRTAIADCAAFRTMGLPMRAAVNLSAADIVSHDIVSLVDGLLGEYQLTASSLALEVTESAIIRSPAVAIAVLTELRARGIRLSIDDYGTGHSTLSYLKQLPVHELKIDKSFVTNLCVNEGDAIMVRSTINMAHELGLEVVAEGIEDTATLTLLASMGCDYGQGYLIGKPMTFDDLSAIAMDYRREERRIA